jgi:hypothetical protein
MTRSSVNTAAAEANRLYWRAVNITASHRTNTATRIDLIAHAFGVPSDEVKQDVFRQRKMRGAMAPPTK